ncbi:MAG TPA: class I SAM-dependent methyltransferase [Methanocorpusculum sp.]|nr:class I SAM-dependent methyltransferase [Methanocorpusculum sp.]
MKDQQIKSGITDCWNKESGTYDNSACHGVLTEYEKRMWIRTFSQIIPDTSQQLSVLDVGCGTGAMGLIFAEMGCDVTGIDLSECMIDIGRHKSEKYNLNMKFQVGDAESLPFPDNSVDIVINRHLLWTLPNPSTALSEWYRVLKPNGILIVIDWSPANNSIINTIRKKLSYTLSKLFRNHIHSQYPAQIVRTLPNYSGIPESKAKKYVDDAGFRSVSILNIDHIQKDQRQRFKWYQKLEPYYPHYLITGKK